MMELDASQFRGSRSELITKEFNAVVKLFSFCHQKIRDDKVIQVPANEEWIRNVFLTRYVRLNKIRFSLGHLNFDAETAEIDPVSGETLGYIDIKITNILQSPISDENEYYAFECKRINSTARHILKKSYVFEGIMRFVNGRYAPLMNVAGMIGFLEKKEIDLSVLVDSVNEILRSDFSGTTTLYLKITPEQMCTSRHSRSASGKDVLITHVFMDMTETLLKS